MTTTASSIELLNHLAVVRRLCPEIRFGQLVAIIGQLAEDETGRNLWDVEDGEFAAAVERFALDLSRRGQAPVADKGSGKTGKKASETDSTDERSNKSGS
jgi:hypothetical protein